MKPYTILSNKNSCATRGLLSKGLLSLSFICLAASIIAQGSRSLAAQAAQLCQDKALDEALELSTVALNDPNESKMAYTWYVHGFVCKEIYKTRESQLRNSAMRTKAIQAFLQAEMKQAKSEISTNAPLRYLLTTLHNDALLSASDFDGSNEWESDTLFDAYRQLARVTSMDQPEVVKSSEVQFYKTKAQRYFDLWYNQLESDEFNAKAIKYYSMALELAPDDCTAVYNIGVAYYDQAVIQARMEGLLLTEMTRVQIAHSYFSKALELCPDDTMIQTAHKLNLEQSQSNTTSESKKLAIKKK
jgi:tetratricopeptide (TPR) repeat protein